MYAVKRVAGIRRGSAGRRLGLKKKANKKEHVKGSRQERWVPCVAGRSVHIFSRGVADMCVGVQGESCRSIISLFNVNVICNSKRSKERR